MTKHQQSILAIIQRAPLHHTADEIYRIAQGEMPKVSMATVYNSLAYLVREGHIRRLHLSGLSDVYDRSLKPHEHMVCDGCGRIGDIFITGFAEELVNRTGMDIRSYDLVIHTLCPSCKKKEQKIQ